MQKRQWMQRIGSLCVAGWFFLSSQALAAQTLDVGLNQAYSLYAGSNITKIAVANPAIADVAMVSADTVLVIGKDSGCTTLIVWTADGMVQEFTIGVSGRDDALTGAIANAIHENGVTAERVKDKILLRGTVRGQQEKDTAKRIAELYCSKDNILDLLQMTDPSQINIEAEIIEIGSDDVEKLGVQYASPTKVEVDQDSGWRTVTMGTTGSFNAGEDFGGNHDTNLWLINHFSHLDATINALITKGKAKILSRPSITTMSGDKANILIGGEIPIPVNDNNGKVTVEWKEYGIKLGIEPAVNADNSITSKVAAEVSTLDQVNRVAVSSNVSIPALRSRKAESIITIPSGMTMVIGGLLNSEDAKTVTKVPFLGDIPVLGEFFRHTEHSGDKRELVLLITPRLVNENTPAKMSEDLQAVYEAGRKEEKQLQAVGLNDRNTEKGTATKPVQENSSQSAEQMASHAAGNAN